MRTPQERFEAKFIKTDGCWNWIGSKNKDGYGWFGFSGKIQKAPRVSYQLYVGEITDDLCVLHQCDNPACVNPSHLFLGTKADNIHDCVNKGRNAYGEKNYHAKLTQESVKTIRAMWASGVRAVDLAKEFNVGQPIISKIVHYHNWKKV